MQPKLYTEPSESGRNGKEDAAAEIRQGKEKEGVDCESFSFFDTIEAAVKRHLPQ